MAGKLPVVDGRRVVRALSRAGFVHSGRDLKPGTLRSIIRQARFGVEEFKELL